MIMKRRDFLKGTAAAGAAAAFGFPHVWIKNADLAQAAGGEIKVGVLYSLTGTTAIIETSLNQATILAIEEINAAGGINGMKVVPSSKIRPPTRRPSLKKRASSSSGTSASACSAPILRPAGRRCCRCSRSITICIGIRRFTKGVNVRRT